MSILHKVKNVICLSVFAVGSLQAQLFDGLGFGGGDCCPGPLNPCANGFVVKGGVAPTWWSDRGDSYVVTPGLIPTTVNIGAESFNNQFHTPWTVGGELTYNFTDHMQLFAEGVYRQGDGKHINTLFSDGTIAGSGLDSFRAWGVYGGARYYLNRWECIGIAPFVGAKLGFVHHQSVRSNVAFTIVGAAPITVKNTIYKSNNTFSFGIQAGFDYEICQCLYLVFTAEGVFTGPMRTSHNSSIGAAGISNFISGETGAEISVPVTLGIRWEF